MAPGIIQINSVGIQDALLTQTPKTSAFKYAYMQYVNFANDVYSIQLNNQVDFGNRVSCDIPINQGHFLTKLFLRIKLPILELISGTYLSWTNTIGYAIFNGGIDIEIGGVTVETFYPAFANMNDSFTSNSDIGKNQLILRSDSYISSRYNANKENELLIPLSFWFTKQYNLALPIVAMNQQQIKIKFKLRNFTECINYDGNIIPDNKSILDANIFAEYSTIDQNYIKEFTDKPVKYLFDYVQEYSQVIPENTSNFVAHLTFNNPCKELIFACTETLNISYNNYYSYSRIDNNSAIIDQVSLLLDGKTRFDSIPEVFSRLGYSFTVHSRVPLEYIYSMPFSILPESNQPSGTLNMSRFDNVMLTIKMINNNPSCLLNVFAIAYNSITIQNGLLTLDFMN